MTQGTMGTPDGVEETRPLDGSTVVGSGERRKRRSSEQ